MKGVLEWGARRQSQSWGAKHGGVGKWHGTGGFVKVPPAKGLDGKAAIAHCGAIMPAPATPSKLQPLTSFPRAARAAVRGVFLDIDDTLTTDGQLTAEAYAALARLHHAGLLVAPITGRPAGWCDHIARMWPVDGVVGENGAFYFRYDRHRRRLHRRFVAGKAERGENRRRLDTLAADILAAVPGTALASDQPYREADLAIDYCEDVAPLPQAAVARIVALFEAAGATAKVSSIHVNG